MRRSLLGAVLAAGLLAVPSSTATAHISSVAIDPSAQLSAGRQMVTVSGTMTCTEGESIGVNVRLVQGSVEGYGNSPGMTGPQLYCTGASQPWSVQAYSPSGQLWHPGRASAGASICTYTFDAGFYHYDCQELDGFLRIVR
jgi:hypothetical protein